MEHLGPSQPLNTIRPKGLYINHVTGRPHIGCVYALRGCLHDNGATFIPGRDEKLHRVCIKPCLLGCESYSAVKLMKLIWIWNEQSYPVYMTPEWIFVPGLKSRSGTRTGVNSRRHDILCWYHVNEYRAIRGNQSELALGWKSPRYHVNTP